MAMEIDIEHLAEQTGPEHSYLSVYINADTPLRTLEDLLGNRRELLTDEDDLENFDQSAEQVMEYLREEGFEKKALALFSCWYEDFFDVYSLGVPVEDQVVIDSSPYVRPLAELEDEYETYCVTYLDHDAAQIYLVAGRAMHSADRVSGDITNHVKKGGWSQQRYERRREKEINQYCDEIAEKLQTFARQDSFDRLIFCGNTQLMAELKDALPESLSEMHVGSERLESGLSEDELLDQVEPLYEEAERASERKLMEVIREQCFRDGLGATGPEEVLSALRQGRVRHLLVDRGQFIKGARCGSCQRVEPTEMDECPTCGEDMHSVDLVNEMVEEAKKTDAEVEFSDSMEKLSNWNGVAALLRY